jgi:hypothetical protein
VQKNSRDLEEEIKSAEWLVKKIQTQPHYAQNLYAAFCNIEWQPLEIFPILRDEVWSCSWRYAGGMIAEIRGEGNYMDYYCSGIWGGDWGEGAVDPQSVSEGHITDEVREDLARLGWHPLPYDHSEL